MSVWPNDFDFKVHLHLLSPDEGGRSSGRPMVSGYRAQFRYASDTTWTAEFRFEDDEPLMAGQSREAYVDIAVAHLHVGKLQVGTPFRAEEGGRVVATGTITQILHLEEHAENSRRTWEKYEGAHRPAEVGREDTPSSKRKKKRKHQR